MTELEKEFRDLGEGVIILVLVSAMRYAQTNIEILSILCNKEGRPGIYVTVNRPYKNLKEVLKKNGINAERLFFVDCITKSINPKPEEAEDVIYLASPASLTDLSIGISEAVGRKPEEGRFLFMDSLTTLLIYNQAGSVSRFAHFLTGRMREWRMRGILISLEKETDEALIAQLTQFCDKVLTLD
jgi:KaiC/GvpD/RAD55 family RecA-like ATPase